MKTILLSTPGWDLVLDAYGNIAVVDDPLSLAQDAASAIRAFKGEVYYDTTQGVPYFPAILGRAPPIALMKAKFEAAALTVPEVVSAVCYIASITDREVIGQVQVRNAAAQLAAASFIQAAFAAQPPIPPPPDQYLPQPKPPPPTPAPMPHTEILRLAGVVGRFRPTTRYRRLSPTLFQ